MEQVTSPTFAYLDVDENAFAFSEDNILSFTVRPREEALTDECFFIIDIYAADDHSHPDGHAGWWECHLSGQESIAVCITRADGMLDVTFDGARPETFWNNPAFALDGRTLTMHLVVRAWRSTSVLFDDRLRLYADTAALEADADRPFHTPVPAGIPPRWFVWPPAARVLLAFDSLRSAGASGFCAQLASLLTTNGIAHEIYAWNFTASQRRSLRPAQYLLHEADRHDIVFFTFSGGNALLPLIAELSCKKILYHKHLPDYRRFQAFDAEFARELAAADDFATLLPAFDGICYESEHTRKSVYAKFKTIADHSLEKAWRTGETNASSTHASETSPLLDPDGPAFTSESLFCSLAETQQSSLPQYLRLTRTQPVLPPELGVFPPALWVKRWENIDEEQCHVPDPFMLSIGSFRPDKHHEDVLSIFAAVAKQHPAMGLVIAGWPSVKGYWDYLEYLRKDALAEFSGRIVFLQTCTQGQLLYLYRRAALFVSACSYEGYSGSLEEALSFKLPVVARQTRTVRDTLGFSGLQYDGALPPEAVAADILKICGEPHAFPVVRAMKTENATCPVQKVLEMLRWSAVADARKIARAGGGGKA